MHPRFMRTLLPVAAVLSAPYLGHAQEISTITGTVKDSTGAVVAGAQVELTQPKRGLRYTAATSSEGFYRIPDVQPGPGYVVLITAQGFAPLKITDVYLNVANVRTQDAILKAGSDVAVQVTAQNSNVTLNTIDASIGNNVDVNQVNDLPIQARGGVSALIVLQPGVTAVNATTVSVTGARTDQNSITVDGLDVNDIAAGSSIGTISGAPADSVQEFRGTVSGLPVNVGTGGGGQYQLVTKSGTNSFHGNVNEYHRDAAFAANTWFNNNSAVKRANIIQNQFGGNIGGPIWHDKAYFFFNYFANRLRTPSSQTRTVPLNSLRNGTLSYIRSTDSATGATCATTSRQNTTPTCIGTLTAAQIQALDPAGIGINQNVLNFINSRYPVANDLTLGDGINTGGYRFNYVSPTNQDNYVARVDYRITDKQSLFTRFTINRQDSIQTVAQFPSDPVTHPFQDRSYSYVLGHVWQIGSNKVNQISVGSTITKYNFATTYNPVGNTVYTLSALTMPYFSQSSQKRRVPIPVLRDDFNWTLGNHNLNAGGTFKAIRTNSNLTNDFNFTTIGLGGNVSTLATSMRPSNIRAATTAFTTYDQAYSLLLGRVATTSSNYNYNNAQQVLPQGGGATRHYRYYQTEAYLGDIWKAKSNLTLDYGVRYMYYSVPYESTGIQSNPNIGFDAYFNARRQQSASGLTGNSVVPFITYNLGGKGNNGGSDVYSPNWTNFAPRFGFAYQPSYDLSTVFRGSASVVYDRTVINATNFIQDQSSFIFASNIARPNGTAGDPVGSYRTDPRVGANLTYPAPPAAPAVTVPYTPYVSSAGVPTGLNTGNGITAIDPNFKTPYNIQYTFGMQKELPAHFIFKVDYAGRLGRHLMAAADGSQLIDFVDPASQQSLSQAFANISLQGRNGQTITPQPWFENQIGPGQTVSRYNGNATTVNKGDFADFVQSLAAGGYIRKNVGMSSQFAYSTFETNKGFSTYNGLLVTLSKNKSHGIRGDFNYTWSHSIDNVSVIANFIPAGSGYGFICDVNQPRACRASSDFDVRHVINANFVWDLPVGRGHHFGGTMPIALDEVVGGWSISGLPGWRSGLPFNPVTGAFVGGYANNAPAIFTGNNPTIYKANVQKLSNNQVNLFGTNVAAVTSSFTGPIGFQIGQRNLVRGPSAATLDLGVAKTFGVLPEGRLNAKLRLDGFNVLNHPVFSNPSTTDITSGSFGQITTVAVASRLLQVSLRLEF